MDATSADEVSALLVASTSGDLEKVQKLLDAGVPAYAQEDAEGVSALMLAAGAGHGEIVSALLIAGAPWNAIDPVAHPPSTLTMPILSGNIFFCTRGVKQT